MNEREGKDVLKCVTFTLPLVQNLPSRSAVPDIRKKDAHMHTCSCTLPVQLHVSAYLTSTFVKHLAYGPPTTYQIAAQSVRPFPRYEKEVRTCSFFGTFELLGKNCL